MMKKGPIDTPPDPAACPLPQPPDLSGITIAALHPQPALTDYLAAMPLAKTEALQHVSGCHAASAETGSVDDAVQCGARLKIDIASGRFVFFHRPVDF